ncbi:hypothetical protein [Sulfitobacter sp. EhC04]|uniref:hypothetical protein n=1 Tax=Sulfitobacter sp. EhC04 TaxID=1849168 RepID=UPI0019148148|nr:hypothetical protein [Sulfitobacter sp. EhC04]
MSNVAGKAYCLNVVTPTTRLNGWVKSLIFIVVRAFPVLMAGLRGLSVIHFARWVIIRRQDWPRFGRKPPKLHYDYTLFCSNFNGTWDQYIDAFSDGIPYMLDLAWFRDYRYPGSIPLQPFQRYIRDNQVNTDYYYNATPGAAKRDVVAALRVWRAVRALAQIRPYLDPIAFEQEYNRLFTAIQNDLGAPGPGVVSSLPTEMAHALRQEGINAEWRGLPPGITPYDGVRQEAAHGEL